MEPGRDTPPVAWWAAQRVRLGVLLVCLGAAIVLLLGARTTLLGPVGIGGGGSAEGAPMWCVPHGLPATAGANIGELFALRAGPLAVFADSGGRRYAAGIVTPEDMWLDDSPQRLRATRLADGLWPAGYEMRWWTRDYDVSADALAFPGVRQARELFEEAASVDCHRAGTQQPARWPPQARNLAWVNPDDAEQDDVFLLRGRRVYRVAAVRLGDAPAVTAQAERRAGLELVDALACSLPAAGCARW